MLTIEERRFFQAQGYLRLPGWLAEPRVAELNVLADDELARVRTPSGSSAWNLLENAPSEPGKEPAVYRLSRIAARHSAFEEVAREARVAELMQEVLGPDAAWCVNRHNMMLIKAPRVGREVPWHQDGVNWGHTGMVSLMVFLEEATPDNGCLQIVPGAHREGLFDPAPNSGNMNAADPVQASWIRQAVPVPARPGDALLFHACTPHHSAANGSERSRRNLIFAYVRAGETNGSRSRMEPLECLAFGSACATRG